MNEGFKGTKFILFP